MADEDISESFSEWQQIPSPSSPNQHILELEDLETNNTLQFQEPVITSAPETPDNGDDHNEKLSCWIVQVVSKIRSYAVSKVGIIGTFTYSKITGILAVVLVPFVYVMIKKWKRQRHELDTSKKPVMLLLKEKDQKIDQLLLQIYQMNDLLQARRNVPVIRVG